MKMNNYIHYSLLCISLFVLAIFAGCSDENDVDYLDDGAYPPPVIKLTTDEEIDVFKYLDVLEVRGSIESGIGLRDIYYVLVTQEGEEQVPVTDKVYFKLNEITKSTDFSFEIPIRDKTVKAVSVVVTDVITKSTVKNIPIHRLSGIPPIITMETTSFEAVNKNTPIQLKGLVSSGAGIQSITYTLIQEVPERVELEPAKSIEVTQGIQEKTLDFSVTVTADNTDAIEIKSTDIDGYTETVLVPIVSINGVDSGKAYIFNNIEMAPEYEMATNTVQPYIFSTVGINVNGVRKNVLTLSEAGQAKSRGLDFAFINVWKNTANAVPMGASGRLGQRGFAFCDVSQLNRGPIGRQCDFLVLPQEVRDTTCMVLLSNSVVESMKLDELFASADGRVATYNALKGLSGITFTPGSTYYILQKTGASADNTTTCVQNIKKGSYIAIRRENNKDYKYGLIRVEELADDSDALKEGTQKILGDDYDKYYTGPNLSGYTYDGVAKLYGRKCKLKIIVQM